MVISSAVILLFSAHWVWVCDTEKELGQFGLHICYIYTPGNGSAGYLLTDLDLYPTFLPNKRLKAARVKTELKMQLKRGKREYLKNTIKENTATILV